MVETNFWKSIVGIDDQQARLSTAAFALRFKFRSGAKMKQGWVDGGLTVPNYDNLPLHIWPLIGLEFKVATHIA